MGLVLAGQPHGRSEFQTMNNMNTEQHVVVIGEGYIGRAVAAAFCSAGVKTRMFHYGDRIFCQDKLHWRYDDKPMAVINCAAFIPTPSVALCGDHQKETIDSNILFPAELTSLCKEVGVPLMHFSTGCLFDEKKQYTEEDTPTRGWEGRCGFYVGTKLAAEQVVKKVPNNWIVRIRLPFDQYDHPKNYISKLLSFPKVFNHFNSLTHRGDLANAVVKMVLNKVPGGIYHCVNTGYISAASVIEIMRTGGLDKRNDYPEFVNDESAGCTLSTAKLESVGIHMRTVGHAMRDAITNWTTHV
jgi:dTDP-4-dehydrorhamnose reductase